MIHSPGQIPLLIHIHVPKCAGTSINTMLGSKFPGRALAYSNPHEYQEFKRLEPNQRDLRYSAVFGHLQYGIHNLFSCNYIYFSVVREPLSRICSYFNYVHLTPEHPDHGLFKKKYLSIDDINEDNICNDPSLRNNICNYASRAYSGETKVSAANWPSVLEKIERSVEHGQLWLGSLSSCLDFLVNLGVANSSDSIPRKNVTSSLVKNRLEFELATVETIEKRTKEVLLQHNNFDQEIYKRWNKVV